MVKKIHNYLNFVVILLVMGLLVGVFYSVLSFNPTNIVSDISGVVSIISAEAALWLDALIQNIDAVQQFYNIVFLSIFTLMMLFFIIIPLFNFFICRKPDLRISRLGLSAIVDLLMTIFVLKVLMSFVFSSYAVVNVFSFLILVTIFVQLALCVTLMYQWYNNAMQKGTLGIQLVNTVGFLVKVATTILIIYFTTNIIFVIVSNVLVDALISQIHIAQMLGSNVIGEINFNEPLNQVLPESVVTFFTGHGFTLEKALSDFGVTTSSVSAVLNSYVFAPIDGFIHNFLNDFTNKFIFKDITAKVLVLSMSIATLVVYQIKLIPLIIKQIVALVCLTIITIILLVVLNYFLFVNLLVILLIVIIITLIVSIVRLIFQYDKPKEILEHEKEVIKGKFRKEEN